MPNLKESESPSALPPVSLCSLSSRSLSASSPNLCPPREREQREIRGKGREINERIELTLVLGDDGLETTTTRTTMKGDGLDDVSLLSLLLPEQWRHCFRERLEGERSRECAIDLGF